MDRHDNSPPLADRLQIDHEALAASVAEAATLVPGDVRAIVTDEEAGEYAETAKAIKAVVARVETARKTEKAAILEAGRTVDGFFSRMSDQLAPLVNKLVAAINAFQRAKLDAERKAAAEEAARLAKEAALFDEPAPVPVAAPVVREAARITSFSGVKATASTKWKGEVVKLDDLPRQYMMANQAAIDAAIKGGTREIPGVRIYEDVRTAIR